jgi:hypothetical protein
MGARREDRDSSRPTTSHLLPWSWQVVAIERPRSHVVVVDLVDALVHARSTCELISHHGGALFTRLYRDGKLTAPRCPLCFGALLAWLPAEAPEDLDSPGASTSRVRPADQTRRMPLRVSPGHQHRKGRGSG